MMMKSMLLATLVAVLAMATTDLSAQIIKDSGFLGRHQIDAYCGHDTESKLSLRDPDGFELNERYTNCGATMSTCYSTCTPTIPTCKYRVPLVFTVITDGSGSTSMGATEGEVIAHIDAALARTNNYYAGAGIEFIQCQSPRNADGTDSNFDSADFYAFSSHESDNDDSQISVFDLNNVINIYLAPTVASSSGNSVCGYAKLPGMFGSGTTYDQSLRSVIAVSCLVGDNTTLEHELGHFFGLEHTHNGAASEVPNEAADGTEACNYTLYNGTYYSYAVTNTDIGDGIADTSPDPNLSGVVTANCTYDGTYNPDASQPLQLNNIMSYSQDFYCHKMVFTSCQLEKIQDVLVNCRNILFCDNAATEVMDANLEICAGSQAPTFKAASACYSWYAASSGGTALASSVQTFTPPMTNTALNTPGTYTYYLEYDNETYNTAFSGSYHDTYNGHSTAPAVKRKAITVTVNSGTCNSTPGDGVDVCGSLICSSSCDFSTSGTNFSGPFNSADYRIGWAVTSGAGTTVNSQAAIDALPSGQVFGPYAVGSSTHTFTNTCTGGVPDLAVGTYNATPFASKVAAAATTSTFSSGTLAKTINSGSMVADNISVTGLPDDATVSQICVTLTHTHTGIVSLNVGAPEGMGQVVLVNRPGFPASKPWGAFSNFNGTYCFEVGASAISESTADVDIPAGTYAPHDNDFSAFSAKEPNGDWALAIDGPIGGTSGELTGWSITFDVPAVNFPAIDLETEGTFGAPIEFDIVLSLPVELIAFRGEKKDQFIALTWTTENEIDNDHFLLQRSTDGIYFETIARVNGAGNSSGQLHYNYTDRNPEIGKNYYRLLTVDYQGAFKASEVVAVEHGKDPSLIVSPNPIQDNLRFAIDAQDSGELQIRVLSIAGHIMYAGGFESEKGINNIKIHTESWYPGTYFLQVISPGSELLTRFIKQ